MVRHLPRAHSRIEAQAIEVAHLHDRPVGAARVRKGGRHRQCEAAAARMGGDDGDVEGLGHDPTMPHRRAAALISLKAGRFDRLRTDP